MINVGKDILCYQCHAGAYEEIFEVLSDGCSF